MSKLTHEIIGRHGGKVYPVRGTVRGLDGEWFRVGTNKGRHNYRVVRVGLDGRSEEKSYRVRAEDFVETSRATEVTAAVTPDVSLVGQRGAVIIAARLRNRLGIHEGTVVIQEEYKDGVWIRPARVSPWTADLVEDGRNRETLAEFLAVGCSPFFGPPEMGVPST